MTRSPMASSILSLLELLRGEKEFVAHAHRVYGDGELSRTDYLLVDSAQPCTVHEAFKSLRWGGQVVWVEPNPVLAEEALRQFEAYDEFVIEQNLEQFETDDGLLWWFSVRKVSLEWGDDHDNRFTFDLELVWLEKPGTYAVRKSVPDESVLVERIRQRHPGLDDEAVEVRSEWLAESFLPILLRREARTLRALRAALPKKWRSRVPKIYDVEREAGGRAQSITMSWLRNAVGEEPLTHLEFAQQAAELLKHVHAAGVLHLDLRPDNTVVTRKGVGFIDFGSAYRQRDKARNPEALAKIYEQVAQGSEVQKKMGRMLEQDRVTNPTIVAAKDALDAAVDLFSLALQLNNPLANPAFETLVTYDPQSEISEALHQLSDEILCPDSAEGASIQSVADVCERLNQFQSQPVDVPSPFTWMDAGSTPNQIGMQ
jgi:tRNA A-37 threonylcarbamoyl transferase component Bud32